MISLILVLIIIPILLGLPWATKVTDTNKLLLVLYSFVMGFFELLAIFQIVFFPSAVLDITLRDASIIYSLALLAAVILSLVYIKKNVVPYRNVLCCKSNHPDKYELLYIGLFLFLLLVQVYFAIFYSRTYMADDGYVVFSTAALSTNYMNLTQPYTGLYQIHNYYWLYRVIQTFNYFPAYVSLLSGFHPAVITHTVFYVLVVLLAYSTYYIIACSLFQTTETRFMFLCLTATIYIFGYHSHYSLTFRLLGPNNEGKAILAVVLAPFIMTIMQRTIAEGYHTFYGLQFLVLSIAACSLTMGGIYTAAALLGATVLFSVIKNKSFKTSLYLLWGGTVPCLFAGIYLMDRFIIR